MSRPTIERTDRGYRLTAEVIVRQPQEIVFEFYSDARNLAVITPPSMSMEVISEGDIAMRAGLFIDYRFRIWRIPLRWPSEITVWEPPHRFVDEHRRGPYRFWIHEHTFRSARKVCRDRVDYDVQCGAFVHRPLVRRELLKTFDFRRQRKLSEVFGSKI